MVLISAIPHIRTQEHDMKQHTLVVVADGTDARLFTLEPAAEPSVESGPRLVERSDLVDTEHRLHGRDKYSTTRADFKLAPGDGPIHGFDDHRDRHDREHDRRFAADVAARAVALAQEQHATHLVIAAEARMLGLLRDALRLPAQSGITVSELATDVVKLAPDEIHAHLANAGLLPARHGSGVA
jgi:protein required for attachment to host cells